MSPKSSATSAVVIVLVSGVLSAVAGGLLVTGENPLGGFIVALFVGWLTIVMILDSAKGLAVQEIAAQEAEAEPDD